MSTNPVDQPRRSPRLLRLRDTLTLVGLGRTAWLDLVRDGKAPRPVQLSLRAVAWREEDVERWVRERPLAGVGSR
jgi:prophage regulatory protein